MPEPKDGKKVSTGCVCGIIGGVIGLGTLCYTIVNRRELAYVDSSGLPSGPLTFLVCCGPLLLLSTILCVVAVVSLWRKRLEQEGSLPHRKLDWEEPEATDRPDDDGTSGSMPS